MELLVYPGIKTNEVLGDLLNRLAWYLTPILPEGIQLLIPADAVLGAPDAWFSLEVPDYSFNSLKDSTLLHSCHRLEPDLVKDALKLADWVLLWDVSYLHHVEIKSHLDRVLIIDPNFYLEVEATNHASLLHLVSPQTERDGQQENSRHLYAEWSDLYTDVETAYLFLTGPSLEAGLNRPLLDNSLRIICNSLVKNDSFLDKIQPNLLVFADPAFHFGISRYAATFRDHALKALTEYPGCICIVPERYLPLLHGHLPQQLASRLIGMPEKDEGDFNFPNPDRFWVRRTENILTHLMLPIATALAPEIHIFGADGRQNLDTGYWQHNAAAQFSGLLGTIYEAHPSIKRDRDVEAYYAAHCDLVEKMIKKGEQETSRRYYSETPSLIPALSRRNRQLI